jgi:hypothetical protein
MKTTVRRFKWISFILFILTADFLLQSLPLSGLTDQDIRHRDIDSAGIDIEIVGNKEVKVIIPGNITENEDRVTLLVHTIRGQRVMNLLYDRSDGECSIYRWSETMISGEILPAGLYLVSLSVADVTYGWSVRYHGEDRGLEGSKRIFMLSGSKPDNKDQENERFLQNSSFLDETDLRLPALEDETTRVVSVDVDGDDDNDILFAEGGVLSNQNVIWINDGNGFFTDETSSRLPLFEDPSNDLDLADVDGDDDLDLVIANSWDGNHILLNDGQGSFTLHPEDLPFIGDISYGVRLCNVTGDYLPDIVFANVLGRNRLYENDGDGTFTDVSEDKLPFDLDDSVELCCQDVNSDSINDLIFFNWDPNLGLQDRLLINDGSGRFHDSTTTLMPDISNASLDGESVDLDGNSNLDLVIAESPLFPDSGGPVPGTGQNLTLINNSPAHPGQFLDESGSRMPAIFEWSNGLSAGDIDGEEGVDLVFANADLGAGAQNRLYMNNGQGFFSDVTSSWLPFREELSTDVFIHDLDGDGDNDILVANAGFEVGMGIQNRILMNQTIVGIEDFSPGPSIPTGFSLSQNYPNPFNPLTTVEVTVPDNVDGETFLGIYDLRGRLVKVIDNRQMSTGRYRYTWDGRNDKGEELPSGVYILRLRSQKEILTRKLSLIK